MRLMAQSETLDKGLIAVEIAALKILQKLAALTYHDQESTA